MKKLINFIDFLMGNILDNLDSSKYVDKYNFDQSSSRWNDRIQLLRSRHDTQLGNWYRYRLTWRWSVFYLLKTFKSNLGMRCRQMNRGNRWCLPVEKKCSEELLTHSETLLTDSAYSKSPKEVESKSRHKTICRLDTRPSTAWSHRMKRTHHRKQENWKDKSSPLT